MRTATQQGIACAAIDAPSHGSRGSAFDFFEIVNLAKARENFRQMAVDQMQLVRAMPGFDVDGDGSGDFTTEAAYFGNSLGSIMGANAAAADPRIKTAVLNVPGGGLSNIDMLYAELPARVEAYAFVPEGLTKIVRNRHGDSSGVRGAAWLWRDGDPEGLAE